MAYSFLIFDFGGKEEVPQQAPHKLDASNQALRLGKKPELKFDRKEPDAASDGASETSTQAANATSKAKAKPKSAAKAGPASSSKPEPASQIRLIVRLDFSDHEKLSHQRWLERIPGEEPFKTVTSKIVRAGDPEFEITAEMFQSLRRS